MAEAPQLRLDDPIHGPASFAAAHTSGASWEGYDECSPIEWQWYNDQEDSHSLEGVGLQQPFHTPDKSVQTGTSSYGYDDFVASLFDQIPLPLQESQSIPSPDVSQLGDEGFTMNSISQYCFNDTTIDLFTHLHRQPPRVSTISAFLAPQLEPPPSASPPPALLLTPIQVPNPKEDVLPTKQKLDMNWTTFTCSHCKEVFFREALYRRHTRRIRCTVPSLGASFECQLCGTATKSPKDLKRHQGGSRSAPACPILRAQSKQLNPFVCTCGKSFSRKDTLQRHVNKTSCPPRVHG